MRELLIKSFRFDWIAQKRTWLSKCGAIWCWTEMQSLKLDLNHALWWARLATHQIITYWINVCIFPQVQDDSRKRERFSDKTQKHGSFDMLLFWHLWHIPRKENYFTMSLKKKLNSLRVMLIYCHSENEGRELMCCALGLGYYVTCKTKFNFPSFSTIPRVGCLFYFRDKIIKMFICHILKHSVRGA